MDDFETLAWDHAPIGLVLAEERMIRACNAPFLSLVGQPRDRIINHSFRVLYDSDQEFEAIRDIGITALRETGLYSDERMMRHSCGAIVWVRFRARTLTPETPLARIVMSFAPLARTEAAKLTPRERDVLDGLSHGMTSKEIARRLSLSPRSIEAVRARLLRKYDVRNTAGLIRRLGGPGL